MRGLRQLLTWYFLLHKRLFKRAGFIVVLALIPVFALVLGIVSQQASGVLHVAVASETKNDPSAARAIDALQRDTKLIQYIVCDSPQTAEKYVQTGKVDSAWIFGADFGQLLADRITGKTERPAVRILEREETVLLRILHEKLYGQLFEIGSQTTYLQFIREQVPALAHCSDEQLLQYYASIRSAENLFSFSYMDAKDPAQDTDGSYLVLPIRGILSVLTVLAGLAAAMYYMRDEMQGTFSWMSFRAKTFVALACQLIPVFVSAAVMLLSLFFSHVTVSLLYELLLLLLFVLCCTGFCLLVRLICRKLQLLAMLLPLAAVAMIAACPVFMEWKELRFVGMLFPPYYYIQAVHNTRFLFQMILYAFVTLAGYLALTRLIKRT